MIDRGRRGDLYFSVAVVARLALSRELETTATSSTGAWPKAASERKAGAPSPLKLNRQRHTTRERGPQSHGGRVHTREPRLSRVAEGENHLSRSGVTPARRAHETRGGIFLPSEVSNVSARFSLNTLLRRTRWSPTFSSRLDRAAPRKMNSEMNTNTPPSRTTHARVLRARARLRRLHRRRQLNPSRNG